MEHKPDQQNFLIEPVHSMSTGGTEELNNLLSDLHVHCMEIQLSMVATRDGLTMASKGTVLDPDQVGAMCSELLDVCHRMVNELEQGELQQMILKSSLGYILLTTAGEHAVLALMAKPESNLGLVVIEAQRTANVIRELL